jgi:hypothetical protein
VRAAAEVRLSAEPCVPVAELAGLPLDLGGSRQHPTAVVLLRWGEGRKCGDRRVYLDVMWCPHRLTWVSSRAALTRFAAEVAAATGPSEARTPSPADTP